MTERIEVPGGWFDIKTTITRGMRKAFRQAGLRGFAKGIGKDVDMTDADALRKAVLASPDKWDLDAIDDAYLLHGIVAYSFGPVVDLATIDALPDEAVAPILRRMQELYAEMPEGMRKNSSGEP